MITFYEKLNDLLVENVPFVAVTIVDTNGSVPNDVGAKMLVVREGLYYGTVGGGKVETRAILEAQQLLGSDLDGNGRDGENSESGARSPSTRFVTWSLDRDIGMTCGGSVKMYFESFNTNTWSITIFGAGHCANALCNLLIHLDCRITCIDPRQEWLDKLPASPKLRRVLSADMPSVVASLNADTFVVLITMGHTTDKPILIELLKLWPEKKFPYVGVIGSKAKAARLKRDIAEAGLSEDCKELFYCPMGLPIGNNHPHEIAISIAAQLLEQRDKQNMPLIEKMDTIS